MFTLFCLRLAGAHELSLIGLIIDSVGLARAEARPASIYLPKLRVMITHS